MTIFIPEAINHIEYLFLKEESYNIVLSTFFVHLAWSGFELTTLVVIGTYCISKSNYSTCTIRSRPRQPCDLRNNYYCWFGLGEQISLDIIKLNTKSEMSFEMSSFWAKHINDSVFVIVTTDIIMCKDQNIDKIHFNLFIFLSKHLKETV